MFIESYQYPPLLPREVHDGGIIHSRHTFLCYILDAKSSVSQKLDDGGRDVFVR
jgi:L-asparaginase II